MYQTGLSDDLENFFKAFSKLLENKNLAIIQRDPTNQRPEEKQEKIEEYLAQLLGEMKKINEKQEKIGEYLAQLLGEMEKTNEKQVTSQQLTEDREQYQAEKVHTEPVTSDPESGSHSSAITLNKDEQELIKDYHYKDIENKYKGLIKVSFSIDSMKSIRGGSGEKPILIEQSPSKYWIILDKYLVPQYSALDNSAMASVQKLFDCDGLEKEVSKANEFTLQRTGKVKKTADGWELVEKGVLDYKGYL